ncbi:MAG TPA: hypothetical protein VK702_08500, partial [Candidatus Acidoferrum sp.]|nr:hypothetical protein [Candidatus Acidoferrum sp.]
DDYDGVVVQRELVCIELAGASVRGANFTGAQLCDHNHDRQWTCMKVDAAVLRDRSHNSLDGAILP